MAKTALPMPKTGGGILPKLVGIAFTLAILTLVIKHPTDAAQWANQAFGLLGTAVDGLATFLRHTLN